MGCRELHDRAKNSHRQIFILSFDIFAIFVHFADAFADYFPLVDGHGESDFFLSKL